MRAMFSSRKSKAALTISCIPIMPSNLSHYKGVSEGLSDPDDGREESCGVGVPLAVTGASRSRQRAGRMPTLRPMPRRQVFTCKPCLPLSP